MGAWNQDYLDRLDAIGLALGTDISAIGAGMNWNDRTLAKLDAVAAAASGGTASVTSLWNGLLLPGAPEDEATLFPGAAIPDGWTELDNDATLAVTYANGAQLLASNVLGDGIVGLYRAAPVATRYRISAKVTMFARETLNFAQGGVHVSEDMDSAPTTANIVTSAVATGSGRCEVSWAHWSAYSTFVAGESGADRAIPLSMYMGIYVDTIAETLAPLMSWDGRIWYQFGTTQTYAAWGLSADPVSVGVFANNNNTAQATGDILVLAEGFRAQATTDPLIPRGGYQDGSDFQGQAVW